MSSKELSKAALSKLKTSISKSVKNVISETGGAIGWANAPQLQWLKDSPSSITMKINISRPKGN